VNFLDRAFELLFAAVLQALLERLEYVVTIAVSYRHHERKTEFFLVRLVRGLETPEFFRSALVDARTSLLVRRIACLFTPDRRSPGKIGMRTYKLDLRIARGSIDAIGEYACNNARIVQSCRAMEALLGDPR
jgi:hypothetical protein